MTQGELIQIVKQINTVDLYGEAKDALTAKVLKLAADSVTLETLKALLSPASTKETVPQGAVAMTLGRKSRPGFTLSKKEIKSMPEKYRNIFACADRLIPYRFHKGVYEAHYRRDGFKVFACAKDFKEMKRKFAAKLLAQMTGEHAPSVPDPRPIHSSARSKARFAEYLQEWLEIKRKTCKESTCKEYERLSSTNLLPVFGERPIADITRQELQGYLFRFIDEGKHRTAEKLYQILCCIFDLACEDLHILSPMKKIVLPYYEPKKGSALTKEEEKKLVEFCIAHRGERSFLCSFGAVILRAAAFGTQNDLCRRRNAHLHHEQDEAGQKRSQTFHSFHPRVPPRPALCRLREGKAHQRQYHLHDVQASVSEPSYPRAEV